MKKMLIIVAVALLGLALVPTYVTRQANSAKEDPKYIRRVYADHTVGQKFQTEHEVDAIQLLIRSSKPGEATLSLVDETQTVRAVVTTKLSHDDQWVQFKLSPSLPLGEHLLTLRSDSALSKETAALVRFQIDSNRYESGHMVVDGAESYGDLAFKIEDRVSLARSLLVWGQVTDKSLQRGVRYLVVGISLVLIAYVARRFKPNQRWIKPLIFFGGLALIAVAIRAPYATSIDGVFGGDAFNYLSKAEALIYGEDPFASDPRKGPFLSLLLVPGFLTADPLLFSRWIGIIAAAATVITLPFIAHSFKLPWSLAAASGLLLAVNPESIWEAPSGLANSLYAFLVVASAALYLRAKTAKPTLILAALLGLTVLTRYEGILVAAILLPALWFRERFSVKKIMPAIILTTLIIAIPFSSLIWSGQPGVRTAQDIAADSGLLLARSPETLQQNLARLHDYTNSIWLDIGEKNRANHSLPALGIGLAIGAVLAYRPRRDFKIIFGGISLLTLGFLVLTKSSEARELLVSLPLFFIGVGIIPLIKVRRYDAIILLLMIAAQLVAITLILPKSRYYLQLIPFITLLMVVGIHVLIPRVKSLKQPVLALGTAGILTGLFYFDGLASLINRTETYNNDASVISVMIEASQYLRVQAGNVGLRPSDEQPAIIYIPRGRRFDYKGPGNDVVSEERAWLKKHDITYAVERNQEPRWQSRGKHPKVFELIKTFDSNHGDEKVFVYKINQE